MHVTVSPRFGHEPCHYEDRLGLGAAGPGLDQPVTPWLTSDTCRAGSLCKRRIREQVVAAGRTAVARAAPAPTADHPSLVGADALGRRSVCLVAGSRTAARWAMRGLALGCGALVVAAFPEPALWWWAWMALVPVLLLVTCGCRVPCHGL